MTTAHLALDLGPAQTGGRILLQIGLPTVQFFFLPIMNWHEFGRSRQFVPKILDQLEFFRWAQVEDRDWIRAHVLSLRRFRLLR